VYVVHVGKRDETRLKYKMDFYAAFETECKRLIASGREIVVVGDVNTAHHDIDIARPKQNITKSGFLPIERAWMTAFIDQTCRHNHVSDGTIAHDNDNNNDTDNLSISNSSTSSSEETKTLTRSTPNSASSNNLAVDRSSPTETSSSSSLPSSEHANSDEKKLTMWPIFVDAFRYYHGNVEGKYSWWSARTQAKEVNCGWRIDYTLVTRPLLVNSGVAADILGMPSSHFHILLGHW
jgi:exonuclease III